MGGGNENFSGVIRHSNFHAGMKSRGGTISDQAGHNRKVLTTIDINAIAVQRRGVLIEKKNANQKNPVVPIHRPVTRKFAAQLSVKENQQISKEKVKPPVNQTIAHQSSIINAENYNNASYDEDVPMYVHHTEAMMEEIDLMDAEVEMEDLDIEEEVMDIDACDKRNPLAVAEYIDDIHAHYRKTESLSCVPSNYMARQFDLNKQMRGILIDWLIEVHYKFELMDETLFLTVNLIDRFLAMQPVVRKRLQLVGITALLLACKYEEVSVPVVEDLVLISDKAYCRKEVIDMEKLMVNTLQFNLSLPTPYVFMRRFLKAAQSDKKLEHLSFFILELCLVEYEFLRFSPSLLAAAAIFTAQCSLSGSKMWSKTCERHTNYTKDQLLECARLMVSLHQKAGNGKLTAVYKKYNTSKFGHAAKMAPAEI